MIPLSEKKVLLVGLVCKDVVQVVQEFPKEDSSTKALYMSNRRGGNASNTACVLGNIGINATWIGSFPEISETEQNEIFKDLVRARVQTLPVFKEGVLPVSHIISSRKTGSRTIIHYRNLPELSYHDFRSKVKDPKAYEWYHFEGKNDLATSNMISYIRENNEDAKVSIELEKPGNESIEKLIDLADAVFFSREYVEGQNFSDGGVFLEEYHSRFKRPEFMFCTWGARGAFGISRESNSVHFEPATVSHEVLETVGAGDTFNAAVIACLVNNKKAIQRILESACRLASFKCAIVGFDCIAEHAVKEGYYFKEDLVTDSTMKSDKDESDTVKDFADDDDTVKDNT